MKIKPIITAFIGVTIASVFMFSGCAESVQTVYKLPHYSKNFGVSIPVKSGFPIRLFSIIRKGMVTIIHMVQTDYLVVIVRKIFLYGSLLEKYYHFLQK